jgi:predicted site-specific integrase-resolvase
MKDYLTPAQMAEKLGIEERTIRRWYRRNEDPLPTNRMSQRIWIDSDEFEAWFKSQGGATNRHMADLADAVRKVRNEVQ